MHREARKHKNIDHESKFHCSKKSNICLKKKFVQRGSPEKKIPAQAVSEKKNSCKLKIPHPPPPPHHSSNGPSFMPNAISLKSLLHLGQKVITFRVKCFYIQDFYYTQSRLLHPSTAFVMLNPGGRVNKLCNKLFSCSGHTLQHGLLTEPGAFIHDLVQLLLIFISENVYSYDQPY